MGERRKGFLMYADYSDYFEMLEDEELGALIKQFFRYTSGKEADISGFTQGMKFVYTMIKNNYERDTTAYKKVCEIRSASAKQRKTIKSESDNKPSYETNEIEESSLDLYKDILQSANTHLLAFGSICQHLVANATDIDIDTETEKDKEIDNDIDIDKEKEHLL